MTVSDNTHLSSGFFSLFLGYGGLVLILFMPAVVEIPADLQTQRQPLLDAIPDWYILYLAGIFVGYFATFIGLWRMEKWSPFLYVILVVIDNAVHFFIGLWNPGALVIPLIIAFILFAYSGIMY